MDDTSVTARPRPLLDGLTGEFYAHIAAGDLRIQRCSQCGSWRHIPRPLCAECSSDTWTWERSAGRGQIVTLTITERPLHPAFTDTPYAIVVVQLAEGPRLLTTILDGNPREIRVGTCVRFEPLRVDDELSLPAFVTDPDQPQQPVS
jgi:uncharacterized OB-fold protein